MRFGSLFSGIGGIDLGLERAGMECAWQVENNPYCAKVLEKHWPNVRRYGDIKEIDWSSIEAVDLICGGFPCQPVSVAGRRRAQADDRWLWPHFANAIRHLRPEYVLLENVPGLLSAGGGTAFAEVLGDLAACGYDAEWDCIPASASGAPHIRYRVLLVAYTINSGSQGSQPELGRATVERTQPSSESSPIDVSDTSSLGCRRGADHQGSQASARDGSPQVGAISNSPEQHRAESGREAPKSGWGGTAVADTEGGGAGPIPEEPRRSNATDAHIDWNHQGMAEVSRGWWAAEPDVGRVAHGVPHRVDRLRGLGNAVVPQVAEWIGRRILQKGAA